MKTMLNAFRLLVLLSIITGGLYPLAVWMVGRAVFARQAEGSLVTRDGVIVGSALLAQDTTGNPRYFHARPSAANFATVPSGAGNQSWTSTALARAIAERRLMFPEHSSVPADLLTASGSGLDPELSPAAMLCQLDRVAGARGMSPDQRDAVAILISRLTIGGGLTPARVNTLALNLALDAKAVR